MSVTFKVVLDQRRPSSTGYYPLKLRVYQDRVYKEQSLGIKIRPTDWNPETQEVLPSAENYQQVATRLLQIKAKLSTELLLGQLKPTEQKGADALLAETIGKAKSEQPATKKCFIKYGMELSKAMVLAGRVGNSIVYSCALNKLKAVTKKDSLPFEAVTFRLLSDFENKLQAEGIKVNSISNYLRTIRAIYNRAILDGLTKATDYPFVGFKIKNEKTPSRALSLGEMQSLVNLQLEANTPIWHWRNYFLLSFCLIGMNFADLLTAVKTDIVDGRLVFKRKKTGKYYSILLHPQAKALVQGYNDSPNGLLLPVVKHPGAPVRLKAEVNQARKTCNEYLERMAKQCGIRKNITTYNARYTWANIARSKGYSKDLIAQALGHEYGNRVTSIYLDDYDSAIIDEMNLKVLVTVFP